MGVYIADVAEEFGDWVTSCCRRDKVRRTPGGFTVFYLCFRRACTQLYRSPGAFVFDQIVHLLCGIFISVGTQSNDYLGIFPTKVCSLAPPALGMGPGCNFAADRLPVTGMFLTLGVLFAGVTVGSATFGRERVVYWRDVSAGMSVLPYFFAKWVADVPRIVIASCMFTGSLILFLPYRAELYDVWVVVLVMYFCAFSMGYFLSAIMRPPNVALATTGWVLLWAMLLGGVTPRLEDVQLKPFFRPISFLWSISAPRWAIEAWYIKEALARPWKELHDEELTHGYRKQEYEWSVGVIVIIGVAWSVAALVGLKLCNRWKMK
ncbi:hypothetical protein HK104_005310 [Borealophlyctis nickersoniae]|nr:hypothetical protein HK104_005310 [Borealophlyctis nickersoniae]